MRFRAGLIVLAMLTGAAASKPNQPGGENITYITSRCYGTCPVYAVTIGPDGQGLFDGHAYTAASGQHRFQATPDQVRAFDAVLAQVRPPGNTAETFIKCDQVGTDAPSVRVSWRNPAGSASLIFYYGCIGREADPVAKILREAPALLPIADLIGKR